MGLQLNHQNDWTSGELPPGVEASVLVAFVSEDTGRAPVPGETMYRILIGAIIDNRVQQLVLT